MQNLKFNIWNLDFTKTSKGFTLIEVLVVIGLAGLIAVVGYVSSIGAFQRNTFSTQREMAVSLLQRARSEAMANINQSAHGIAVTNTDFILFDDINEDGDRDSGGAEDVFVIPRDSGVAQSGDDTFSFAQLSGNELDGGGSLTLTGKRANVDEAIITVDSNGRIDWVWN